MKKNISLKIFVLFIALFLWAQQQLLKTHVVDILIDLHYENLPDDLAIMIDDSATHASAIIAARGLDILRFKMSNPVMKIDASDFRYGKNSVDLIKNEFTVSDNYVLQLKQMEHQSINWATTDRLITSEKPVKFIFASAKEEEFFIKNKIMDDQVQASIKGPLSIVTEINYLETERLARRLVRDGFLRAKLIKPHEQVDLIEKELVLQIMQTRIVNKTISLIPIQFPLQENVLVIPQKVTVMVRGPEEIVDELNINSIRASIEFDSSKKSDFVDIRFELPAAVKIIDYTPQKIQVIRQ